MKICLIDPSGIDPLMVIRTISPLGASCLAAVAESKGAEARILHRLDSSNEQILGEVIEFDPEIVCFCSVMTRNRKNTLKLADEIKKENPERIVILGGDDPSIWPQVVENESIDYIGVGMGEPVISDFIDFLRGSRKLEEVRGLGYFKNGKVVLNPQAIIDSLDEFPFPKRRGLPWGKYKSFGIGENTLVGDEIYLNMRASVGCNNRCSWCNTWRLFPYLQRRGIENVEKEIKQVSRDFKIGFIDFMDANLVSNKKWFFKFCKMISQFGLPWRMFTHPRDIDRDLLETASKAGCKVTFYGLDIIDNQRLKKEKGLTLADFSDVLKITHEQGIHTIVSLIIGWEDETRKSIERAKDYLIKNPSEGWYITFLTNFRKELEEGTNPDLLDTAHPPHDTEGLTKKELLDARREILTEAYNSRAWKGLYEHNCQIHGGKIAESYRRFIAFIKENEEIKIKLSIS